MKVFCAILAILISAQAFADDILGHKLPKSALPVPIVQQETNYSCGAAALLSALKYWQVFDGVEQDLYQKLNTTPENGTHPKKITEVALQFGLHSEMRENLQILDLEKYLAVGKTVILDIQAWPDGKVDKMPWSERWEDGHYVVLIAIKAKNLYAMDPSTGEAYTFMPLDELMSRWHDYEDELNAKGESIIRRYYQMAIIINGAHPLKNEPKTRRIKRLN